MTTYSDALRELAEPRPVGDTIKVAIWRAARIAGLPYARAFNVWYGRARRIDAHEARQIEEALQNKREEEARNELHDLRTRLLKMESRIAAEASNSNRARLDLDRSRISGLGGVDSALARRK